MTKSDMALIMLNDCRAALGLLSRLPVRVDFDTAQARGAHAAWAYPVAGAVLGTLAWALIWVLQWAGFDNLVTAGIVVAALVTLTGAMHEDGLADSLDGLWGGWDRARRLEIMKDSRIGVYGVIGLGLSLGLRWAAVWLLLDQGLLCAVIAVAVQSRAAMVPIMAGLPHARNDGLSQHVGRPPAKVAGIALAIGIAMSMVLVGMCMGLALLATGVVVTTLWAAIARRKIAGQTGDILGATQQFNEIAMLLILTLAV